MKVEKQEGGYWLASVTYAGRKMLAESGTRAGAILALAEMMQEKSNG